MVITGYPEIIQGIASAVLVPVADAGKKRVGLDVARAPIKCTTAFNTDFGLSNGYVALVNG